MEVQLSLRSLDGEIAGHHVVDENVKFCIWKSCISGLLMRVQLSLRAPNGEIAGRHDVDENVKFCNENRTFRHGRKDT